MSERPGHRRGRWLVPTLFALLAVTAPPAEAIPLPPLLGLGQEDPPPTFTDRPDAPASPPAGGTLVEGETLTPGTMVKDADARGGAFLRTDGATGAPARAGFHEIIVRARGSAPTRARITVDGQPVAAYTLSGRWRWLRTVVAVTAGGATVGVESEALPDGGPAPEIDVDWLHLGGHEAVFTVAGNDVLDRTGAPTVSRGVTMPGYQAPRVVGGVLELPPSMAAEQHAWGVTLVRLPLNQEHWLANCPSVKGGVGMGYRAAVDDEVQRLTSRGIMTLLTLTRTERGRSTGCAPASQPEFKEMADTRSVPFWRSVATRFAPNSLVAFDLFNEPHHISDDVWRRGGSVTYEDRSGVLPRKASFQAVGMQTLIDAVRSAGADNLVFVSGTRWAADPRAVLRAPLDGYGIVVAVHTYCHGCPPGTLNDDLDVVVSEDVMARHAVMISETGWIDPRSSSYNRRIIDWAAARGLGWSIYAWGHPDADYSLLASWAPASFSVGGGATTFEPSRAGAPVWNALADIRVARGFDARPRPES